MGLRWAQRLDRLPSPVLTALASVAGERVLIVRDHDRFAWVRLPIGACTAAPSWSTARRRSHRHASNLSSVARITSGRTASTGHCGVTWVDDIDPAEFSLHRFAIDEWGGFVVRAACSRRAVAGSTNSDRSPHGSAASRSINSSSEARSATTSPPIGRCSPRTTTSATTAGRCILSCANWCRRSACAEAPRSIGSRAFPTDPVPTRTRPAGTSERASFPGLNDAERVNHFGELIYPNLMLSLSRDHVAAFVLQPVAADRTMIECQLLFHPDEVAKTDFDPSDAIDFWHMVNLQDWAICERVQRGMTSRTFDHGWYAPMEDPSLDIRRWWTSKMKTATFTPASWLPTPGR